MKNRKNKKEGVKVEELKQECVDRLKILGLDSKIINDFEEKEKVYISVLDEGTIEATQYDYVLNLIKSFEKNWNVKIYHVISIAREMRDTVHVLYVSKDKSKWKTEKEDLKNGYIQAHTLETVRAFMQENIEMKIENGKIVKVVYNA